jgi:hypothetical protein
LDSIDPAVNVCQFFKFSEVLLGVWKGHAFVSAENQVILNFSHFLVGQQFFNRAQVIVAKSVESFSNNLFILL